MFLAAGVWGSWGARPKPAAGRADEEPKVEWGARRAKENAGPRGRDRAGLESPGRSGQRVPGRGRRAGLAVARDGPLGNPLSKRCPAVCRRLAGRAGVLTWSPTPNPRCTAP